MTMKERNAIVAELQGRVVAHDTAAADLMRAAANQIRRARAIERELERLEKPKRTAASRVAFA